MKTSNRNRLKNSSINTRLAHLGNHPFEFHGFINPPVTRASTVLFPDHETMLENNQKYTYGTKGTPTTDALCEAINDLEGSAGSIILPSGLAAISVSMLAFAESGKHCLIVDSIYGPTRQFANSVLRRLGLDIEYFDPRIGGDFSSLLRENTSMILFESPGSDMFEMVDIKAIVEAARETEAVVMMDNTWATPLFFRPLDHDIDISIHALTKYPCGHSDLLLGSASANDRCWKKLRTTHFELGTCAQGDDCYATLRGMRTMAIRLSRHEKTALQVANWLHEKKQVSRVLHPGLPDHPDHAIWKRDFSGSSGLFAFVLKDATERKTADFINALNLFGIGYSWGGYVSLVIVPDVSNRTIAKAPEDGKVIRLQIGLEDAEDIINDLDQAFKSIL